MTIAKTGNDWIVTPSSTSTDDTTYIFKVNATDGCNVFASMSRNLTLHVGCPAAAGADTYTLVNTPSATTTLTYAQSTSAIAAVTY